MNSLEPTSPASVCSSERLRPERCVPDEKRRQARLLFEHGIGWSRAAWILGLPEATVRTWSRLHLAGSFDETVSKKPWRYPEETREEAVRLRAAGCSWREIRERTGVSQATVRKWMEARQEAKETQAAKD